MRMFFSWQFNSGVKDIEATLADRSVINLWAKAEYLHEDVTYLWTLSRTDDAIEILLRGSRCVFL